MCSHIFQDKWEVLLHIIFKGKRHILADNRFIHCQPWWPRLVEELSVEEGLKQSLIITLGGNQGRGTCLCVEVNNSQAKSSGRTINITTHRYHKIFRQRNDSGYISDQPQKRSKSEIHQNLEQTPQDDLNYGTVSMAPLVFQDDLIHSTGWTTLYQYYDEKRDIR